ncbi:MAG: sugar phosphate isomerase/epimerase [Haliscomenobacter sp.]|uniref:sugar phosphate isomerase/epimerase family protein n=1 Tax=Haliscomenobacter sp. TaxID=2717303 RepID=UPI0029B4B5FE|nr:sugar phosphate isomerase/epimerase [Haliscomenobacter sp.]MDX2068230.1 sugar phosphate isomerase/epimerase [Haliscomenobacter sp.]
MQATLKSISIGLLVLFCVQVFAQTKFGKVLKTTPGIVSYTFRNEFAKNVPQTLDNIKALGITNIEFSNLFGKTSTELREMLNDRGMICTSYGVSYEALQNKMDAVIQDAKTLGAEFVRVAWIPHTAPMDLTLAQKTVADFNSFGQKLKENGLTFCYHNHGFEFLPYQNGTYFDYIVQNTNPDYVSFEMDILWVFHPGQDPAALLKKYPTRFRLMHVKDLKKGVVGDFSGGTPVENDVTLGTGQLDLPKIMKAARKTKIKHYYIEDESPIAGQQVPLSLLYLKGL